MSKPNPRLSKGIVRTLAREAQHSHSHPHPSALGLVGSHLSSSSSSSTSTNGLVEYGPHLPPGHPANTSMTPSAINNNNQWSLSTSYLSWDSILPSAPTSSTSATLESIVLPYSHPRGPLRSSLQHSQPRSYHTHTHTHASKRYSTAAASPSSSFLTPSFPPSFFSYDKPYSSSLSAPGPGPGSGFTPAQTSLDELLAALELNAFFDKGVNPDSTTRTHNAPGPDPNPPFHSPPSPGPSSSSQPQHPMKPPRPAETHTVLSPTPLPPTDSGTNGVASVTSYPSLAAITPPSSLTSPDPTTGNTPTTSAYSSSLIFHLGASGLPKDRLPSIPSSSAGRSRPPAPPRQRSFPLPDVTAPANAQLRSVAVGEDAYFARFDGMCIADGVGGWARSGAGGADPGRWSRLLTHFCEVEVGDWWAGKEVYLEDQTKKTVEVQTSSSSSQSERNATDTEPQWAKDAWASSAGKDGMSSKGAAAESTSGNGAGESSGEGEGRTRRPLDPVEIMQRGYEKCLACVTAEGILGSSTCLLALLHHSTLHVANLGDCCLLLIRQGEVVFRTSEMQHAFNFPLQLGTHSRDEPMKDAMRFDVPVKKGDIVVLGSDGLMDNLFDEDILDVLAQFTTPSDPIMPNLPPTPPNSRPSSASSSHVNGNSRSFSSSPKLPSSSMKSTGASSLAFPPFSPQRVSEALCRRARAVSELVTATTPFMCKAIEEGIDFVGGKKDDISVLVGVVGDRQQATSIHGDGQGQSDSLALHT